MVKLEELGFISGDDVKFKRKPSAEPFKITAACRIPIPLLNAVNTELEKMLNLGVLKKVSEPTVWWSPLIIVL